MSENFNYDTVEKYSDESAKTSSEVSLGGIGELLAASGRDIDELGGFDVEIKEKRSREDVVNNRPGPKLLSLIHI